MNTTVTPVADKTCYRCKAIKVAADFYPCKRSKDGLHTYCKACSQSKVRKWVYDNLEKVRAHHRELRKRPEHQARMRRARDIDKEKHPQQAWARSTMNNAIRAGKLTRLPCETCGNPKSHGHHHDYMKPYDVHWLCQQCHGIEHRRTAEAIAAAGRTK